MNLRPPELAVKYGVTAEGARKIYQAALKRLRIVVEALDGGKDSPHDFEPWKQMVEERSGSLPAGVIWFLLNELFQMRPAEIARMEGVNYPSEVRGLIIRVSDQLIPSCAQTGKKIHCRNRLEAKM